ncbi:MAG TPA: ester cyclase [Nitrososphaeraceae archaeon]|jgi:predicted ester cyclase
MSFNSKKSVALQFVEEVLNKGNLDKIKNFVSPNIIWHGQYKEVKGLKSFKKWISLERSLFPDMRFSVLDNVTEHDKVAIRWTLLATLKNKPTKHTKLRTMGLSIFQFEDDKIKESWIAFDALGLALQLGVVDVVPSKVQKAKKEMIPFE